MVVSQKVLNLALVSWLNLCHISVQRLIYPLNRNENEGENGEKNS